MLATKEQAIAAGFTMIGDTRCCRHVDFPGVMFLVLTNNDAQGVLKAKAYIHTDFILVTGGNSLLATSVKFKRYVSRAHVPTNEEARTTGPIKQQLPDKHHIRTRTLYAGLDSVSRIVPLTGLPELGIACSRGELVGLSSRVFSLVPLGREPDRYDMGWTGDTVELKTFMRVVPYTTPAIVQDVCDRGLVHLAKSLDNMVSSKWLTAARSFVAANKAATKLNMAMTGADFYNGQWGSVLFRGMTLDWNLDEGGWNDPFPPPEQAVESDLGSDSPPKPSHTAREVITFDNGTLTIATYSPTQLVTMPKSPSMAAALSHMLFDIEKVPAFATGFVQNGPDATTPPVSAEQAGAVRASLSEQTAKVPLNTVPAGLALVTDAISFADALVGEFDVNYVYDWISGGGTTTIPTAA